MNNNAQEQLISELMSRMKIKRPEMNGFLEGVLGDHGHNRWVYPTSDGTSEGTPLTAPALVGWRPPLNKETPSKYEHIAAPLGEYTGPFLLGVNETTGALELSAHTDPTIPDVSGFLEEVTPADLVMNESLQVGYAFYAYSESEFGQFTIPPDWIYEVPSPSVAGVLGYDGTYYGWLSNCGFIFAYGDTVTGMMAIPTDRIDATNSPALNQYPKYSGSNKVTWTNFPTIPDVSDFLEEVTPEDLVMYNDADVLYGIGYAFYAYDGENFGQTTIPPPSDSQYQMLFGADQSTSPGRWVTESPTPGSLMFINYDYAAPDWIPTPAAAGTVLKTVGGTDNPVFESMYIQELISTGGPGTFVLGVDVDGTVSLSAHTEVDEVPPATMPWSMLFGKYIDGVGYRWDEKRPGAPFGAWCIGYGGNEYHPFTAFGSAGQVLTAQGEDAPPFFSHLDITDLVANGYAGEYVVNVVGGKVGLSSLPPDDVGLEVVTPEDLVMYNDADVLYGIGYAFYAYDGENFGQTTIPPPSDSQYQMLFGADQSTSPGRWVTESPTPGSLMFINYDYAAPDWIPTPAAAGTVLKTVGGTDNPVFESMYIQELISTGGPGTFVLGVDVDGTVSLSAHTEVDEVPPATMPWSMLFGKYIDGVGYRWDEKRPGAPFGAWCIGYGGNEYHPFTAFGSAGQVLTAQGEDAPPFFSHLDITDLVANGYAGEYVVNVVGGKVGLSSLPPDDVGLEVVTPEDLVMYNDADVLYGIGYAFYAYDGENFGQTTIPPPSDSQYQMLFGADQSTSPGRWVTESPTPGSLMFINYDYAAPDWIPTPAAAGTVLKTVGGTDNPVFESMYIQELISTGGPGTFVLGVDVDGTVSLSAHTEVDEVPPATMPWSMLFGKYIDGVGYRWDEKRPGAPFGAWCIGYGGNEYHPFTAFGSAGQVLTAQGEDAPPFFSHLDITDLVANGYAGEYVVNVVGGKVGLSSLPPDDVGLEVVTPEDLVMYNDADVLYGIGYAFYAYDGENFGQTTIPPPSDSQYQMLFGADQSTSPGEWVTESPTPGSLMFINYDYAAPDWIPTPLAAGTVLKTVGGLDNPVFESMYIQELLSTGGAGTFVLGVDVDGAVSLNEHTETDEVPPSARKWDILFGADQSTNPGEWAAWYAETYGLMWFNYDATSESYNPALIGQSDSGKALVSTGFNTPPAFRYLYGGDIVDISSYTGDSLPGGTQGDILYNDGSDWQAVSPFLNSVFCFEKNKSKPEPIFLYNDYTSSYNIHKYLHFSGSDATPSVDQIEIEHTITTNGNNYGETCLISVNEYGEVTLTPYAYSGMLISNLMDLSLSSCEILLQLNGDGDAAAKEIVDPAGTMSGDYVMIMSVTAGVRTFKWVTYGD